MKKIAGYLVFPVILICAAVTSVVVWGIPPVSGDDWDVYAPANIPSLVQ